jgi:beta-glucosidase
VKRPLKQLQGFRRIALSAGQSAEIAFELPASELRFWDVTRQRWCLENGSCTLLIGSSSSDIKLSAEFAVDGETVPSRNLQSVTSAVHYDDYACVFIGEGSNGGSCVVAAASSAWIRFDNAAFTADTSIMEATVLGHSAAALEVRLNEPDGPLAGRASLNADHTGWHTISFNARIPKGQYSVYLVLEGEIKLQSFHFRH